jgi:hypothetical protein
MHHVSQKKINQHGPQGPGSYIFLSMKFKSCCGRINLTLFEHHTCIFYSITMQEPIVTLLVEIMNQYIRVGQTYMMKLILIFQIHKHC